MRNAYTFLVALFCFLSLNGFSQSVYVGDTICAGDSGYVYVIPDSGKTYTWFDAMSGGTQVGSGDTLWTGPLTTSTTFYAQGQAPGSAKYTVGPADNSFAGGSNYNFHPDGVVFSVSAPVTIDTVYVYPNGPGNVVINIENSGQTNIFSTTVAVTSTGKTPIPVGYTIAPGTGYRMHNVGTTTGGLFRNTGGAMYPYTSTPLSITGAINTSTTFYYKFYDWRLSAGPAPDPRVGVNVTVNPNPTFNLGPDINLCENGSVTFNDPSGLSCTWSNGSTGPVTVLDSAAVYTAVCVDTNGCTDNDTIELIAVTPYVASLPNDTTVCVGTMTTICASPDSNVTFNWSNGDAVACATFATPGIKTLLAIDNFGCSYLDTTEVIHQPAPTAAYSPDTVGCPTIVFNDASTGTPSTWAWNFGDGSTDTLPSPQHTYSTNGVYTVTLTATNACGSDSSSITLNVNCIVGRPAPLNETFTLYPNPGSGLFQLQSDARLTGQVQVKVLTVDGRLLRDRTIDAPGQGFSAVLDLRQEPAGIYLIQVSTAEASWSAKVQLLK